MNKFQFIISILELFIGVYGIWWIIIGFLYLSYDGWGLLCFPIAIPFLLVGVIGYKQLRSKPVAFKFILLFLLWVLYGTISMLLEDWTGGSLIGTYKSNLYMFIKDYIVPIILIFDLISRKLITRK